MIFIGGISNGQKKLDFVQTFLCKLCGQYGRYEVFMTYTYFSFFFIPLFKWNRKFYVSSSCCNCLYELDKETGQNLLKGIEVHNIEEHLTLIKQNVSDKDTPSHLCQECGFPLKQDFDYCPKCGTKQHL